MEFVPWAIACKAKATSLKALSRVFRGDLPLESLSFGPIEVASKEILSKRRWYNAWDTGGNDSNLNPFSIRPKRNTFKNKKLCNYASWQELKGYRYTDRQEAGTNGPGWGGTNCRGDVVQRQDRARIRYSGTLTGLRSKSEEGTRTFESSYVHQFWPNRCHDLEKQAQWAVLVCLDQVTQNTRDMKQGQNDSITISPPNSRICLEAPYLSS